ncbi:TOMM precursor leader peptide-binding protein [Nonomuraea sp. NPDC052265]|uniref:TOMM precursor leader peptide-binding protein n=1 Tax=Nonomuraea sp. NPDC052265 TaxID=3364374 RepID=UPI0037C9D211
MAERWVVGTGDLAELIASSLGTDRGRMVASVEDAALEPGDVVIAVREGWDADLDVAAQRVVRAAGARLLPCRVVEDLGLVGPWVEPDQPGCQVCAERRRRLWRRQVNRKEPVSGPLLSFPLVAPHLSAITQVVSSAVRDGQLDRYEIFAIRGDLRSEIHRFLPLPHCPECDVRPEDSRDLARTVFAPRPQPHPESFRINPDGLSAAELRDLLIDRRYGPVGHVFRTESSPLALVSADLALPGGQAGEGGHGRAETYARSEVIALYEAVERLTSGTPHGKRTVVHGSSADLDDAVDLPSLGLHDPAAYDDPGFRLTPYAPDVPTDWVWGWQIGADRPVLVPEHVAYWSPDPWPRNRPGARFLYETSNGCASGSSLEEAVLYGLLEVAERDAFLMTWYGELPVPPLAVEADEVPVVERVRALLDGLGYDLLLFDMSNDLRIPAVMSVVVGRDPEGPQAFFAASAHCNPYEAIATAAKEAATNAVIRARMDPDDWKRDRERGRSELLDDHRGVKELHDHSLLYALPETRERWRFLLGGQASRGIDEAFGDWRERWCRPDLTRTLEAVLAAFGAVGLDPIVVDQTDPGLGHGLSTVKMIVPQSVPMTFGHVYRRVHGLTRLCQAPYRLGYWSAPKVFADLNTQPHPFP